MRYIALLRGINVSGKNKLPMADLRTMLSEMGLQNIKTYIQSGNIIFESDVMKTALLEDSIAQNIMESFGFKVPVLVNTRADFELIFKNCPYTEAEAIAKKQVYFVILKNLPENEAMEILDQEVYENEVFEITDYCVYLKCTNGYGKAKLNNNLIERKLKVEATTRNYATMVKLLEMSLPE